MVKVFDVKKFTDSLKKGGYKTKDIDLFIEIWANDCQGLSVKEINELGYVAHPNWLIAKEVE